MIVRVKACTIYLLTLLVFLASALAGVDGMVLCLCSDGGVEIEKACGDADTCCNETHRAVDDASHPSHHQCSDCTDLALRGVDTFAASSTRIFVKTSPDALPVSLPRVLSSDADAISAHLVVAKIPAYQYGTDTRSTVFRI